MAPCPQGAVDTDAGLAWESRCQGAVSGVVANVLSSLEAPQEVVGDTRWPSTLRKSHAPWGGMGGSGWESAWESAATGLWQCRLHCPSVPGVAQRCPLSHSE